jgi:hypothetical protein
VLYYDTVHICRHSNDFRTWTMETVALADMGMNVESLKGAVAARIPGTDNVFVQTTREIGCWNRRTRRLDFLTDFVSATDFAIESGTRRAGKFPDITGR